MRHKLWLVIVILLLAAAGLFAFAATGHTYFAALLALIAALIVFYRFAGRVLKIVVTALLAIGVVVFVIIEIPIVKAARTDAPADCDYIVVLGAGLHGDVPSLSLRVPFAEVAKPLLADDRFLQPHRSYVVNLAAAAQLSSGELWMRSGARVPIPRGREPAVRAAFRAFLEG